ncbi:Ankyrin-1 [Bienertia sinuspersici]
MASSIFTAASNGDLKRIKEVGSDLIDKFGEQTAREVLGAKDPKGRTILHIAAEKGRTHVCKYLVETIKCDVNVRDLNGITSLHYAVLEGYFMTSSYLLDHGALPKMATNEALTPLHYAAEKGRKDQLRLLISKGAEVDAPSTSKGTPLQCAAGNGMKDAVKILLDYKANPNATSHFTPLIVAILANSVDCVRLLLKNGADPNLGVRGEKPLFVAVSEGMIEIIKCLLKAGADPNATNFHDLTPIELAAIEGNLTVVNTLFDVTTQIPNIPVWSCQGILDYVNSSHAKEQRELNAGSKFLKAKENGAEAVKTKDFLTAIYWYTEAITIKPTDATVFSNRSLCWARLNEGSNALSDAMHCIKLKRDWPKAYYRAGVALRILKDYEKAAESFVEGLKFDPHNRELQDAHRETLADLQAPTMGDFKQMFADCAHCNDSF